MAESGPRTTIGALTSNLGGHPNAIRQHLDALVADGLVSCDSLPPKGRGRPARGYTVTPAGRRALAGREPYVELVSAVTTWLSRSGQGAEEARQIGQAWGRAKAEDEAWDGVVELLDELGFDPTGDQQELHLRACPLLDEARRHPDIICGIHQGLLEGALGHEGVDVEPFAVPGACIARIRKP